MEGGHNQQVGVDPGRGHPWEELFKLALKYGMYVCTFVHTQNDLFFVNLYLVDSSDKRL